MSDFPEGQIRPQLLSRNHGDFKFNGNPQRTLRNTSTTNFSLLSLLHLSNLFNWSDMPTIFCSTACLQTVLDRFDQLLRSHCPLYKQYSLSIQSATSRNSRKNAWKCRDLNPGRLGKKREYQNTTAVQCRPPTTFHEFGNQIGDHGQSRWLITKQP